MTIPLLIFHKKYVGSLQISVQNFLSMEVVEAFQRQVCDKELIISKRNLQENKDINIHKFSRIRASC